MELQKFFGKLKKPKYILVRRTVGLSMMPSFKPGQIVLATPLYSNIVLGDVIIVKNQGREIVKRVSKIDKNRLFIRGDNNTESTDSRHFGWIDQTQVYGKVIWPRKITS